MSKKKHSTKNFDDHKPMLPGMGELKKNDDTLADEYLSKIMNEGFVSKNKVYLQNYLNSEISIALSHIKNAYKSYVCSGKWSEEKFNRVRDEIISKRFMFTGTTLMKTGILYDEGKLKKIENTIEPYYSELSEEQVLELLKDNFLN